MVIVKTSPLAADFSTAWINEEKCYQFHSDPTLITKPPITFVASISISPPI